MSRQKLPRAGLAATIPPLTLYSVHHTAGGEIVRYGAAGVKPTQGTQGLSKAAPRQAAAINVRGSLNLLTQ